ncbi:MAG: hypothetical protein ACLTCI_06700 [[Clostridium] nexile]
MLNEERVKLMVQLASYEEKKGKEDFKVSSYYKKDYVSFHRLATMIWTTIGYGMIIGLLGVIYMDQVLEELTLVKAIILVAVILIIYVIVLVAYWIASRFYQKKHSEARARVKKYSHNLLVLNKLYEKENM